MNASVYLAMSLSITPKLDSRANATSQFRLVFTMLSKPLLAALPIPVLIQPTANVFAKMGSTKLATITGSTRNVLHPAQPRKHP